MVATSLPFWMQHPSRAMSPFSADSAMRLGPSVAPGERGPTAQDLFRADPASGLSIEVCDAQAVVAYEQAWGALADRALEPNVFLEPGFALPAIRHFPPAQRPAFLLVWRDEGAGRADLVGLCALRTRKTTLGLSMSTGWTHDQATLSAPLLDRDRAGDALALILDFLARRAVDWSGLLLQGVALDGPLMTLMAERGLRTAVVEQRVRTVLRRPEVAAGGGERQPAGSKQAKELRRQKRRLADDGAVAYRSARSVDDVRLATEQFLHLEARGWKGGRGTALLSDAGLAAFTRAMTRQLARSGRCRIDTLTIGGQPAAMGIVLQSGNRSFFWKTTYDEQWKRFSPGKQLADMMRQVQLSDPTVTVTDSCAVPDHPMIGHVWSDRMSVADLLVAGAGVAPARLQRAVRVVRFARTCRGVAKTAYGIVRRALPKR